MKRVLFLSPFFYPEPISTGKYNSTLVAELAKMSKVTVMCFHPIYPDWVVTRSKAQLEGVEIIRGGANLRFPRQPILRRLVLEATFALYVIRKLAISRNRFDVVIGILPPSLFYFFTSRLFPKRTMKVAIVHDLQSVYAGKGKGGIKTLFPKIINRVEASIIRSMDKVFYLSKSMRDRASKEFDIDQSVGSFVIYPHVNIDLSRVTNNLASSFPQELRHIVYAGALGEKQHPMGLLSLFEEATHLKSDIKCHIFSSGPIFEKLKLRCQNPRIVFGSLVPEEELSELYQRSTVQLIPQVDGTSDASLPSKLPNLLKAGCPIFAITYEGSELSAILNEFSATCVYHHWASDLATKLVEFANTFARDTKSEITAERITNRLFEAFEIRDLCREILCDSVQTQ